MRLYIFCQFYLHPFLTSILPCHLTIKVALVIKKITFTRISSTRERLSRATKRISFPPRLRLAPVYVCARVSPPARNIARRINIRAKYLLALLQAYPCARDTRGEAESPSPSCAHVTPTRTRTHIRDTVLVPRALRDSPEVGIILLPNYSAWPPIMRPQRDGHGNNVDINGAVMFPPTKL